MFVCDESGINHRYSFVSKHGVNQKEEGKEAGEEKKCPFSHSFSLCCVFHLWKTDSESERETEKKILLE